MNANVLFSPTASALLPTSKKLALSFTNSQKTVVNLDKLYNIMTRLERLTLSYFDSMGNVLQLCLNGVNSIILRRLRLLNSVQLKKL